MSKFIYDELLDLTGVKKGDVIDIASDLITIMFFCKKKDLSLMQMI